MCFLCRLVFQNNFSGEFSNSINQVQPLGAAFSVFCCLQHLVRTHQGVPSLKEGRILNVSFKTHRPNICTRSAELRPPQPALEDHS